jgi:hypothetical protein
MPYQEQTNYDFLDEDDSSEDATQNLLAALFSLLNEEEEGEEPDNDEDDYFSQVLADYYGNQDTRPDPYQKFGQGSSLMDSLRQRESGGNYRAVNNLGYSGAYQFGAPALEDVGLLKKGASKAGNKALHNPENWTIPGGREQFLSSRELQDQALNRLFSHNKKSLSRMGLIKEDTAPELINAMLAAAHLSGPGGVKKLMRGANPRDAYGTGAREYFNLGLKSR